MEVKVFFNDIENVVINELMLANSSIKVAMSYFTNSRIMEILDRKVRGGVKVELLLRHDETNIAGPTALDFRSFKGSGGYLVWAVGVNVAMNEKFCIIDDSVLIEGTFNWTYSAELKNDEHIFVWKDSPEVVDSFVARYNELCDKYNSGIAKKPAPDSSIYEGSKKYNRAVRREEKRREKEQREHEFFDKRNEFIKRMEVFDLTPYTKEYLEKFIGYWTATRWTDCYDDEIVRTDGRMRHEIEPFVMEHDLREFQNILDKLNMERKLTDRTKELKTELSKIRIVQPEIDLFKNYHKEVEFLNDILQKNKERLIQTSTSEVPYFNKTKEDLSVWDYIHQLGLPGVVESGHWYDILFKTNSWRNCSSCKDVYTSSGKSDIDKHYNNIKCIEVLFGIKLLVRVNDPNSFGIGCNAKLMFKKLLSEGYAVDAIKKALKPGLHYANTYYDMDAQDFKELIKSCRALMLYSNKAASEFEEYSDMTVREFLKETEIQSNIKSEKTLDNYVWRQYGKEFYSDLPERFIKDLGVTIEVDWRSGRFYATSMITAIDKFLNIEDIANPQRNSSWSATGLFWVPKEIIEEGDWMKDNLETVCIPESDEQLLNHPAKEYWDSYIRLFEKYHNHY